MSDLLHGPAAWRWGPAEGVSPLLLQVRFRSWFEKEISVELRGASLLLLVYKWGGGLIVLD